MHWKRTVISIIYNNLVWFTAKHTRMLSEIIWKFPSPLSSWKGRNNTYFYKRKYNLFAIQNNIKRKEAEENLIRLYTHLSPHKLDTKCWLHSHCGDVGGRPLLIISIPRSTGNKLPYILSCTYIQYIHTVFWENFVTSCYINRTKVNR